jgi:polygalacturonase
MKSPETSTGIDRRTLLRAATLTAGSLAAVPLLGTAAWAGTTASSTSPSGSSGSSGSSGLPKPSPDALRKMAADDVAADRIIRGIELPRIPPHEVSVLDFGAVPDGTTDNTTAFAAAIAALARRGGGRVIVPAARRGAPAASYFTGPIHLESRIDLHVESGATILFNTDPNACLPTVYSRWQGIECFNYSPLIYCYGKQDVAVTGGGVLDGQATTDNWWAWKNLETPGFNLLQQWADDDVPVAQRQLGNGYFLPPTFIEPYACKRVLIQGVTFQNSPFWHLHPTLCSDVTIQGVTVQSTGPNTDGCDPECCDGVFIDAMTFNTGDDCIALKSGRNTDGRRVNIPTQNVVIQRSSFANGHGIVTIGSEMTGGVKNVYARDLTVTSTGLQSGHRIKTNSVRGGYVLNSNVYRVQAAIVAGPVLLIDYNYGEGDTGTFFPDVTDVSLIDWAVGTATQGWDAAGYTEDHIGTLLMQDVAIGSTSAANIANFIDDFQLVDVTIAGVPVTSAP